MSTPRHPRRRSLMQRLAAWLFPSPPVAPPPLQQAVPYRPPATPPPPVNPRDAAVLARFREYQNGRSDRTWAQFLVQLAAEERNLISEVAALEKTLAATVQRSRIIL